MKKDTDFSIGDLLTGADPRELYLFTGYDKEKQLYIVTHTNGIEYLLSKKHFFSLMKKVY